MDTTLGRRIAMLRRKKNLKQDELAQMLNVSPQAVSKWENDQTCPDINSLPTLAKILGVSVDELLSGKPETQPDVQVLPVNKRKNIEDMVLRLIVDSGKKDKVRINIPVVLLKTALEIGLDISQISGNNSLKNIDFEKILEMVDRGVVGNLMEVESGADTVKIFVE